mgnify:CR=1 FL=1
MDSFEEHWLLFFRKIQYRFWSMPYTDEELRQTTMLEF